MGTKMNVVQSRIIKIYELEEYKKLIKDIKVAACMITESHQIVDEASVLRRLNALTRDGPSDGNCCSCCGVGPFETRAQQTAHYKHHWHTHNLKRKLFGKEPLSLGQFNSREDESSSSESDSEGEDITDKPASDLFAACTRHCKAFFSNKQGQVLCIYRCALHHKKEELSTDGEGTAWVERVHRLAIPLFQRWAVLMVSGGHFAGAIFSCGTPIVHKTFHTYVARRHGQAQIVRDQRGNAPRSAGASLRRHNQAKFLERVQELMAAWHKDLSDCFLVLYRAVGSLNQAAIFGKKSPLKRDDLKVRVLPFPTQKPSYKEVKRIYETVCGVEVYDSMELFQKALIASTGKINKSSDTSVSGAKKTQKPSPNKIDRAKSRERAPRELPTQLVSSEDEGPCYIDSETPPDWIKTLSEQSNNGIITNSRKDLLNDCNITNDISENEIDDESIKENKRTKKSNFNKSESKKSGNESDSKKSDKNKQVIQKDSTVSTDVKNKTVKDKKEEKKNVDNISKDISNNEIEKCVKEEGKVIKENESKLTNEAAESEKENRLDKGDEQGKKGEKQGKKVVQPQKIPVNVKKMWKIISGKEVNSLQTIFESLNEEELEVACNTQDPQDGNTALHKAAIAAKPEMIMQILKAGGDPCIRNNMLQTPYAASSFPETRIAFRMFQAENPDKYNYAKSQIPGPVTPELLEQEKERKAQQKRAKRQREKEKQIEKNKTNKFLLMTDSEKVKAKENRCFLCALALPRKPFEYEKYRFCSIQCLQNHRNIRPLHKSAC